MRPGSKSKHEASWGGSLRISEFVDEFVQNSFFRKLHVYEKNRVLDIDLQLLFHNSPIRKAAIRVIQM